VKKNRKKEERKEALIRILVMIVSGIILGFWRIFIYVLILTNLIYTLIAGKRLRDLAVLSETWNTQWYTFQKYIIFLDNRRPFPFGKLEKNMDQFKK